MGIRISGLNSGLDTDSLVQALMSAQRTKQTKVEAKKTKLEWKQEIWDKLSTKLYNFQTNAVGKLKMQSAYKTKAAASSDNSKITATAASSSAEGTYRVKVNSLASAQYLTGGQLKGARAKDDYGIPTGEVEKVTSKTKLVDLLDKTGSTSFTSGTQIVIESSSAVSTFIVDEDTTVGDFVKAAQDAGLTATFDEDQQRVFINSSASGKDQAFTIHSYELTSAQQSAVDAWQDAVGYDYLSSKDRAAVSKIFGQLQSGQSVYDGDIEEQLATYAEKGQKAAATAAYRAELEKKFYEFGSEGAVLDGKGNKILSISNEDLAKELDESVADVQKMTDKQKRAAITKHISDTISKNADEITARMVSGFQGADGQRVGSLAEQTSELLASAQTYYGIMEGVTDLSSQLKGLGLGVVDGSAVEEGADETGMVVRAASDASISLNGATLTSSSSSITVNGLTLNILDTTPGQEVTVSVTRDTSAVYDTIKDFISEYNAILKEMNTLYNAGSSRGYEVLTDEQKEAMSDDEVEKWETKIKDSLLRRDDTLSTLISSFRNNMMGSYTASDGKTYSLSSLGISTGTDYTEGGLLHIWGDEDEKDYGDEKNKLEEMLNKDPDLVMEILSGLTTNLYNDLQKKGKATKMKSTFTFYNDKEMKSQISDYKKEITKWQEKLAQLEDRYYSQFTAMEKAMASLNSQQNYFSSMMG